MLSCPYFGNKTSILLKIGYSHVKFLKIETPPQVMPIYGQKSVNSANILSKTQVHSQKTHCSYTHISSTNVYSLKYSCIFFFNLFLKNPLFSCPYLVKKTSILSKVRFIMGHKSQQDAFFSDFSRKKEQQLVCQYFVKNVGTFSKNTLFFYPHFVNKRLFSQIFMYFFSICS